MYKNVQMVPRNELPCPSPLYILFVNFLNFSIPSRMMYGRAEDLPRLWFQFSEWKFFRSKVPSPQHNLSTCHRAGDPLVHTYSVHTNQVENNNTLTQPQTVLRVKTLHTIIPFLPFTGRVRHLFYYFFLKGVQTWECWFWVSCTTNVVTCNI